MRAFLMLLTALVGHPRKTTPTPLVVSVYRSGRAS